MNANGVRTRARACTAELVSTSNPGRPVTTLHFRQWRAAIFLLDIDHARPQETLSPAHKTWQQLQAHPNT